MYGKTNAISSYGKIANAETNPLRQLVMLYDGAIGFLERAAADIESRDLVKKAEHVNRALDILNYLQGILDFEKAAGAAQTLDRLYTIVSMTVLRASADLDPAGMRHAGQLFAPVSDSWLELVK